MAKSLKNDLKALTQDENKKKLESSFSEQLLNKIQIFDQQSQQVKDQIRNHVENENYLKDSLRKREEELRKELEAVEQMLSHGYDSSCRQNDLDLLDLKKECIKAENAFKESSAELQSISKE